MHESPDVSFKSIPLHPGHEMTGSPESKEPHGRRRGKCVTFSHDGDAFRERAAGFLVVPVEALGKRETAMNRVRKLLGLLLALVVAAQLTACSKTVQWEEEVPLNTGETIWVKRSDSYVKGGDLGNPLKMVWGLEKRAYEFSWHGQKYAFETKPRVSWSIILIYVFTADNTIAIVHGTRDCAKPGYGEFRWINGGWHVQKNISPVLIGQPRNVMGFFSSDDGDIPARVDVAFKRNSHFDLPQMGGEKTHLLKSEIAINCSERK